jgi:hypothetical protein
MWKSSLLSLLLVSSRLALAYDLHCLRVDFITAGNHIGICMDPNYASSDSADIIFGALDELNLDACISSLNQDDCNEAVSHYHSTSQYLNNLASNLLADMEHTCPCVTAHAEEFSNCYDVIDSMRSYCDAFLTPTTPDDPPPEQNDDHTGEVDVSTCSDAISQVCGVSPGHQLSFEEALSCLITNAATLEARCSTVLSTLLASIATDCSADMASLCPDSLDSPVSAMTCLLENMSSLSAHCRSSLMTLARNEDIPCAYEASYYCAEDKDVEAVLHCLSRLPASELSTTCASVIAAYDKCKEDVSLSAATAVERRLRPSKPHPKSKPHACWDASLPHAGSEDDDDDAMSAGSQGNQDPAAHHAMHPALALLVLALLLGGGYAGYKRYKVSTANGAGMGVSSDGTPAAAVAMSTFKSDDLVYNPLPAYDMSSSHGSRS